MPPPAIKTVRELIFYQYAKIIAASAGFCKEKNRSAYYKFLVSRQQKLSSGEITMSSILRELKMQITSCSNCCEYCGSLENLSWDHIIPRARGGRDDVDNHVLACRKCNSSKGCKELYEWYGIDRKDELPRIVAGKYLKMLYEIHEKNGTLEKLHLNNDGKLDVLDLEMITI
jgi:HNH endonuclease